MKNLYRKALFFTSAVLVCICVSGCGCGKKKEPDAEASQVMKITITPEPSPTPAPDEMNPEAVSRNGNLTMVNGYLADKNSSGYESEDGSDEKQE